MSKLFPSRILADVHDEDNNAISVALVNPGLQWSTTETDTGFKDSAGRTIFRKVVSGLLASSDTADLAHGITNLRVAEGAHLIVRGTVSDGTDVEPLGLAANVTVVTVDATNVSITSDADLSSSTAVVLLEYTKTS